MDSDRLVTNLTAAHSPAAIRDRLRAGPPHSYLRDFVYGAVDGVITTFAVVSGVAGAGLSSGIVIILGASNLVADGFSMAVSNYLGTRAERDRIARVRQVEDDHISLYPDGEREEIRQIFAAKGFSGESLKQAVSTVTSDRKRWIDTMIQEEYGLNLEERSPTRAAAVTFCAFVSLGAVPLLAFFGSLLAPAIEIRPFLPSALLTATALFVVGAIKARFVSQRWYRGGLETLIVGSAAASLAFLVGAAFGGLRLR